MEAFTWETKRLSYRIIIWICFTEIHLPFVEKIHFQSYERYNAWRRGKNEKISEQNSNLSIIGLWEGFFEMALVDGTIKDSWSFQLDKYLAERWFNSIEIDCDFKWRK